MDQLSALVYLIIGGGGFLGANIIDWLLNHGFTGQIVVLDPKPRRFRTINIPPNRVRYIKESFMDEGVLDRVLGGVTAVFHLASIGHYGLVAGNRDEVFKFNVGGTKTLIKKCKIHRVSRFVYASSVAVSFIGVPLINASEDDPKPAPEQYLDFYSASKAEADQFVLRQSRKEFKTVCLRFRAIYGVEDPVVTHKVATMVKRGLFVAKISAHSGRESKSSGSSGINCAKSFFLADQMLQNPEGLHGRAYNIVDGEEMGQYEFWNPMVMELGGHPPSIRVPYAPLRLVVPVIEYACYSLGIEPLLTTFELAILANDNTFSWERARQELGYQPEPSSMDQVAEYYSHVENCPDVMEINWWRIITAIVAVLIIILSFVVYQFYV